MVNDPVVFVVDDDDAVRESLELSLKLAGYRVECFASALAFLASGAPSRPGCLVTDIRMPDMDGLELQGELKKRNSALPVIVITGHGDVPLAVRAMKAGAGDFLEKPFARDALLGAVQRALEHNANATDDASREAALAIIQKAFVDEAVMLPIGTRPFIGEFNTRNYVGWPSDDDPYAVPEPTRPQMLLVLTKLTAAE